jgi:UDP-N-acetylmuramate: L-alanyl-gamma-D-glutamyl-meso-diaminopimelate ligase
MHIHILGICGTFMAGVAAIARSAGHRVTGADQSVYPPMSDQLAALGIDIFEGYGAEQLGVNPDVVVVGNVMTRGMPVIEELLNRNMPYTSGPEWLANNVLRSQRVVGVAGTHGKTTTTSLLAWILEYTGHQPGFLIGGIPADFDVSARLGGGSVFVIEADEYDTAFFDKRAKFLHYRPEIQIIGNLEFDHADIYPDLAAIQRQFHQLIRVLPAAGHLIVPAGDANIDELLQMGCWTPVETFSSDRQSKADWVAVSDPGGDLVLQPGQADESRSPWSLTGAYNAENAIAAILAARQLGVEISAAMRAIAEFSGVKRRLELRGTYAGVELYDDFAHHPTAVRRTIAGVRERIREGRVLVVLEPRSNTMKAGVHQETLANALSGADKVWVFQPDDLAWDLAASMSVLPSASVSPSVDAIVSDVVAAAAPGDRIVVMSNGGFMGIHSKLEDGLDARLSMR